MPFKTKRQKVHAAKNRVSFTESGLLTYKNTIETKNVKGHVKSENHVAALTVDEAQHMGVRNELAKIFLLSSVIIGLQLALKALNLAIFR